MAVTPAADILPCGRHIGRVWDHLADGTLDMHERTCPYCQDAADWIRPLLEATRALAAEPVRPPDDLTRRVMTVIRARAHPATPIPLPAPPGMRTDISQQAAAIILRAAGDTVDGVQTRSCRLTPVTASQAASADLTLSISLRYGMPAARTARAVRAAIRAAARRQLGLTLTRIDIDVTDIHPA